MCHYVIRVLVTCCTCGYLAVLETVQGIDIATVERWSATGHVLFDLSEGTVFSNLD